MTLAEINIKLEVLLHTYPQKLKELQEAELKYNLRYWDLFLKSGMGTVGAKEAEANLACNTEGLLEPLQILRADVKALYHKKDFYLEIARNLRAMQVGQERTEVE